MERKVLLRHTTVLACLLCLSYAAPARDELPAVFGKPAPASIADLKVMERHVESLIPRLSRAVVAVEIGNASGSGVVVSYDGLVLTAAHVCNDTNRDVKFIFPDGSTARGKTLGLNHDGDAGMMRITSPGYWPHVEVGKIDDVSLGDWVLTLGHPGGFDAERSMVVRLGRIIRLSADMMQTDCTLVGGDSGGPLFDMHGRVIGIHSRISDSTADNFHVPISAFRTSWERLVKGESWGNERPTRRWTGTLGIRGVDEENGCKLTTVEETGPGYRAGLRIGDVVRKINDHLVPDYETLKQVVRESKPGDELKVELERDDKPMTIKVKIESKPR